jgi:hypothetical protein
MAGRRGALRVELGCRGGDGSTPTNVRTGVDRWCGMVFTVGMTTTSTTTNDICDHCGVTLSASFGFGCCDACADRLADEREREDAIGELVGDE